NHHAELLSNARARAGGAGVCRQDHSHRGTDRRHRGLSRDPAMTAPVRMARRKVLATALAMASARVAGVARAADASAGGTSALQVPSLCGDALPGLPVIPELDAALGGTTPRFERLTLDIPRLADNGNAVPMKVAMAGPFREGAHVTTLALYSEKNPVPLM